MKYHQITVKTTSEASELVAYFLQEVCMDGVSILDKNDLKVSTWDYADEDIEKNYADEALVSGYCEERQTDAALAYLGQMLPSVENGGSLAVSVSEVDGDAWIAKWKENFRPIDVGNVVVCPEWLTTDTDKKVLKLETGASFGTGQHETTSMCLELLQQIDVVGKTVVDVGCGSGILGLASLLLGAKHATLIDNDRQATEVAVYNAKLNGLTACHVVCASLVDATDDKFDVLLANLTADILYLLAKDFCKVVKSGTQAIFSGILNDLADKVSSTYEAQGFVLEQRVQKGEWTALLMVKR